VSVKALRLIQEYLAVAGHGEELAGPLFRPVKNNTTGTLNKALHPTSVYKEVVRFYGRLLNLHQTRHAYFMQQIP